MVRGDEMISVRYPLQYELEDLPMGDEHFDVIVIGTGFGATVVATELAKHGKKNILMLERGVWWFTPERPLPPYITRKPGGQREPLQYWPRPDHRQGLLDLISVVKTNNDAIEDLRNFGVNRPTPLYRYNSFNDIDILTASGVGGGSLVYSNVSIAPLKDAGGSYPVMDEWPLQLTPDDYKAAQGWMLDNRGAPGQVVTKFPLPQQKLKDPADPGSGPDPNQQGTRDPLAMLDNNPHLYLGRGRLVEGSFAKGGSRTGVEKSRWLGAPRPSDLRVHGRQCEEPPTWGSLSIASGKAAASSAAYPARGTLSTRR